MEQEIRLIWKKRSQNSIRKIYEYIAKNNPQNAAEFIKRMIQFGQSLTIFPEKYAPCRFEKFMQHGYHCVVFEKNYILFYKCKGKKVFICNVIHTSRLK
jgi:plasmid stabilization system protein ParE